MRAVERIELTSEELIVISDVMRRVEPIRQGWPAPFVALPEFASALTKIDAAKEGTWKADREEVTGQP